MKLSMRTLTTSTSENLMTYRLTFVDHEYKRLEAEELLARCRSTSEAYGRLVPQTRNEEKGFPDVKR